MNRNTLIQSSFERKNLLGKSKIIESKKDKELYNRNYQKSKLKKLIINGDC